ncbi:hypothetical protein IMZ48_39385 [Candidatus Bathyarchaeota archaeon]|nr:hypothetical protein [Candidatus Bathyarchaeota archaeon]
MDPSHDNPPPPYSETDIYSQPGNIHTPPASSNALTADDALSSSTGDVQFTPPQSPTTARSVPAEPSPAVAAYFDSRPAPSEIPSERLEHTITISAETRPEDLALQPGFPARDVTEQDWRTFVNFLLPGHAARSNEAVVERKLRAASDAGSAPGDAKTQLGSITSEDGSQPQPAPRREDVERTVEEWNAFFFGPRGISIRLSPEPGARQMPGAWDQAFDNNAANTGSGAANANAATEPANQRSWGLGGIRVTQDGISIGNILEARRGRIRVGQFTADQSGISYAGRPIAPTQAGYYGAACPGQVGPSELRGEQARAARADRSLSSESSSDSDSEGEDHEVIDELLDYDELFDRDDSPSADQYNVCSQALQRWLSSPDQHITGATLRALKQQLHAPGSEGGALPQAERKERKKELKALIKVARSLAKRQRQERREVRRQEKQQRRAGRRERRQQQKEVRRTRREHRREGRRGHGHGGHVPSQPSAPPAPHGVPGVSVPSPPTGVPGVSVPPAPLWGRSFGRQPSPHIPPGPPTPETAAAHAPGLHIPAIPRAGRGGHPFAGRARPSGAYQGRESFFAHHVAPGGWPHARHPGQGFHRSRHEGFSRAVKQLGDRVAERTEALSRLEGEMAGNAPARRWGAGRMEARRYALEKEIESLQSSMEGLRVHADREQAKLAEEEGRAGGAARA